MDDPEIELVWDDFHRAVNMTSGELREWLLVQASGEEAFPADPDLGMRDLGPRVVDILRKRKVDLTGDDVKTMQEVVDFVEVRRANPPAMGVQDAEWRRSLMSVGHDPLKP